MLWLDLSTFNAKMPDELSLSSELDFIIYNSRRNAETHSAINLGVLELHGLSA